MRKSKNKPDFKHHSNGHKNAHVQTISPSPSLHHISKPENLKREISTNAQKNYKEGTILYGEDDALPLRIAQAVSESPAATACLDTVAQFIKGAGFSDPELMDLQIDPSGKTLWQLHCDLADSLSLFWGFAVNFKFSNAGKIIGSYYTSFESCRFKKPDADLNPNIDTIKYNPYFGTDLFKKEYTTEYPVFDFKSVQKQLGQLPNDKRKSWPGQIYYYGKTSPLHRFYPVPKYWSAKEAIQADHKLQEFNNEELENGFFQSVLINAIGDPNQLSKNPKYQETYTDDSGVERTRSTKTIGDEFNEDMGNTFAGSRKAGTAMVLWSADSDTAVKITAFPVGINGDRLTATQDSITKTITIATKVPSILANISEGVSLGSGGSEIQKAIELMQSRTQEWRTILQDFYNNILFPNMEKPPKEKVEIQNFNPVTQKVEIEDKFWEFLNDAEKIAFLKKNFPNIEIIRAETPAPVSAPVVDPENPDQLVQPAAQPNEALKNINQKQLDRILNIAARYSIGLADPNNKKALTYEQAKSILLGYGLTEADIPNWLVTPDETTV